MTLPTIDQARSWRGLTLVATDDEPVGKIEAIYVDRTTRQPEWALVNTGLFGSSRTFVPLADAAQRGDTVQVPHETSVVREAPRLEQDAELSEEDEARLYAHYGIQYTTDESASGLPAGETPDDDGGTAAAGDATTELPPSSRLEADAPAAAGVASDAGRTATTGTGPTAASGTRPTTASPTATPAAGT
ncbi:MAG TPA: PRC-barrel domain-containing protein, partial [Actinomycetota bacterium]|nr:PRC-barrel domain-containing protein [Actinomycetota bacterium]